METIKTLPFEDNFKVFYCQIRGIMGNIYKVINRLSKSVNPTKNIIKLFVYKVDQRSRVTIWKISLTKWNFIY
jgi:hypothetical protein